MNKLIFANSGTGKTTLVNSLIGNKITDTDKIQCNIFDCSIGRLIEKLKKLSSHERAIHKVKLKLAIKNYQNAGYTILTPSQDLIKYCDLAIIQQDFDSIKLTNRENVYTMGEEKFNTKIKEYLSSCLANNVPVIFLKENQYLADIIRLDNTKKITIDGL